jgi:galactokinase
VKAFVGALKDRDSERMGLLLADSHKSLRDLYEVSCRELDSLVDIASAVKGVVGARMTGAGFGGCAIAIVEKGREKDLEEAVLKYYPERTGIEPEIYISEPSQGAGVEKLK